MDDFGDDINVPSTSNHITDMDVPEQRLYTVKPELVPQAEIFSEKAKQRGTLSDLQIADQLTNIEDLKSAEE